MLIPNESTPLAIWWFEYNDKGCIRFKDHNQTYNFLLKCQATYEILAEAELFYLKSVRFETWMKYDPSTYFKPHRTKKKDTRATFSPYLEPSKLADECFKSIQTEDPFVYPLNIKFYGWGYIFDELGNRIKRPTLMGMDATSTGFPTIEISTYSDVWLAYDVYGKPQQRRYELNAPRLQKALTQVRDVLGVKPLVDDDDNELAIPHEDFTISNKRDSLGDILVYDTTARRVL